MATLLSKMDAAAAQRLVLPPGRLPAQEIPRYKTYLKVETHRLKMAHRAGGGGVEICAARAHMLDLLLRHFWNAALKSLSPQARNEFPRVAFIALGGYGRGELNPHSDVDLMFLHTGQVAASGKPHPCLGRVLDGVLYPLWDLGCKVGHSVRTLDEAVAEANREMQSKTAFIEARLLAGDEKLFTRFQAAVLAKCVKGREDEYIAARLEDQAARRAKAGNSACLQEPGVKNGCGGLRDFQNLLWMAFFKCGTRSLDELAARDLMSGAERRDLAAAYDFLLRVRTEMHYQVARPTDVLTKALQPAVAHGLGYHERSPSKRIERFMRDFYTHSRNVFLLTRMLEQRLALAPRPEPRFSFRKLLPGRRRPAAAEPVDGFKFVDGEIRAVSNRVFRDSPRRLMRVFLHAQQRGLRPHPDLVQLIRSQLPLVNRAFLADAHVHETFITILNQRGDVARTLRVMHETGILGKYVPEFGRLTCLVQHEFYHQYAADEHTLMCLEQLDRVWGAKTPPQRAYAPLLQALDHPYLLYLALLLHDVGKADKGGHHAAASALRAGRVARRLGLGEDAAATLRTVIEHHLLLAATSQRRDLEDPEVIRGLASIVRTPENLALLTLLTFADSMATSDKLWNGFKDALLWSLYRKVSQFLAVGSGFQKAGEQQMERLKLEVRRELPAHFAAGEVGAHFDGLPARYFHIHNAHEIAADLELVRSFMARQRHEGGDALAPAVHWRHHRDRGYSDARVCTWDRPGLFNKVTGALSAAGLNILAAQIFTRADGVALDVFSVTDGRTGALAAPEQTEKFDQVLQRALGRENLNLDALIARQKPLRPLYQAYTGEQLPTDIKLDNAASETRSLIEIVTEDRIGLLHAVSRQLAALGVNISAAIICTEKGAALDTFYVHEQDGRKIDPVARWPQIEAALRQAIAKLEPQ